MNEFASHLDWIASQDQTMRRRLGEWAGINSGTDNLPGLARMAEVLKREFASLGAMEQIPLSPTTQIDSSGLVVPRPLGNALRLIVRADAPLRILFNIHFDTVYSATDPFQTVTPLDGNMLRGPGVTDAKGGLVIMLSVLELLERTPWAKNVGYEVLLNPDEEIGSPGSQPLFTEAARRNHLGLLFEPAQAGGTLASQRKGSGNFTFVIRGRAAHAGRDFGQGRSAVVALADLVMRLSALNSPQASIIVNVGSVQGGGAVNIVPDLAIARVNTRTTRPEDEALLRGKLDQALRQTNALDGITAELHGFYWAPPKLLDAKTSALLQAAIDCGADLGVKLGLRETGGTSDGNRLAALGLTNVDSLGPRGGNIHNPEEFIHLDSLVERARIAGLLVMKLASGAIPWPPK